MYDAGGNGLPWAKIRLYNDFGWSATQKSEGPPQTGKYEFAMGGGELFHLVIVDIVGGQELSEVVDVEYQPGCSNYIDWQRVQ